jgi:hypothetical protein
MKTFFQFSICSFLLLAFISCQRNPKDVTPPVFEYLSPIDGTVYSEDAIKMNIAGRVVDWNSKIKEMRHVTYNSNIALSTGLNMPKGLPAWGVTGSLSPNSTYIDINFDLFFDDKDYASGYYTLELHAEDEKGNFTSIENGRSIKRQFYLKRPYMPLLEVTPLNPSQPKNIKIKKDSILYFDGTITQKRGNKNLEVTLVRLELFKQGVSTKPLDRVFINPSFNSTYSNITLPKSVLPSFTNNKLTFAEIFAELPRELSYFANINHQYYTLRVSVEDEGKNITIENYTLEIL